MREQGWHGTDVVAGRVRAKIVRFGLELHRGGMESKYPAGNAWSPKLPFWPGPGSQRPGIPNCKMRSLSSVPRVNPFDLTLVAYS